MFVVVLHAVNLTRLPWIRQPIQILTIVTLPLWFPIENSSITKYHFTIIQFLPFNRSPGLSLDILKMESWTHMGHNANIIIKDVIHVFASISKIRRILLMGRHNRERWSLQTFAHAMTALLSWHVPNLVAIPILQFGMNNDKKNTFLSEKKKKVRDLCSWPCT